MAGDLLSPLYERAPVKTDKPAVPRTGRFVPTGGGNAFVHDCGLCGSPNAPHGFDVRLRMAVRENRPELGGYWLCSKCVERLE